MGNVGSRILFLLLILQLVVSVPVRHAQETTSAMSAAQSHSDVEGHLFQRPGISTSSNLPTHMITSCELPSGKSDLTEDRAAAAVAAATSCTPYVDVSADCASPASSAPTTALSNSASSLAGGGPRRIVLPQSNPGPDEDEEESFLDRKDVQHASLVLGDISSIITIIVVMLACMHWAQSTWAARPRHGPMAQLPATAVQPGAGSYTS